MKKRYVSMIAALPVLGLSFGALVFAGVKTINTEAKAGIALDDTTDYANESQYGWRTKNDTVQKAYANTDSHNVSSPVYTDGQYSSTRALQLKDKGSTTANSAIAVLNAFGTPEDVSAGNVTWADVKTKKIEFMLNFESEKINLTTAVLDLATNTSRLTSSMSITPDEKPYLSSTDGSEWYHYVIDLSLLSLNTGETDANKVGGFRICTTVDTAQNFYIDQLRLVDTPTFDPDKATVKPADPFDDKTSMYEDDDLARANNFYGGKYTYTNINDDTYSESSTSALKLIATANIAAYGNFFFDVWKSGITLDKLGDAKLVAFMKGSLSNTGWLDHATRFTFTFSTSDHQKATGSASATFYFENLVETEKGWYYMEFPLKNLVGTVDTTAYPLDTTTVYGLRMSQGNYIVATGDYYIFDALMVIDYKDTFDLIDDVTNVSTCSSSAEVVSGYNARYLALNGYDKDTFDTTVVTESIGEVTLAYKLNYMVEYYGVTSSSAVNNVNNNATVNWMIMSVVFTTMFVVSAVVVVIVIKKKRVY